MDLALKKIELINWLTKQDEEMVNKIDELRNKSKQQTYTERMQEPLISKLKKSQSDIKSNKIFSQKEVEDYFNNKTKN